MNEIVISPDTFLNETAMDVNCKRNNPIDQHLRW